MSSVWACFQFCSNPGFTSINIVPLVKFTLPKKLSEKELSSSGVDIGKRIKGKQYKIPV
jgi:hypothetical protein